MLNSCPRRPLVTLRLHRIRIGNSELSIRQIPSLSLCVFCAGRPRRSANSPLRITTSFENPSDAESLKDLTNAQFLSEKTPRNSAAPSDQNWEFGIEHSSDPFFVSLRLLCRKTTAIGELAAPDHYQFRTSL